MPEVVTIVAIATLQQSAEAPTENTPIDRPFLIHPPSGESSESSGSSESGGGNTFITDDGNIITSISVKNGDASYEGKFPISGMTPVTRSPSNQLTSIALKHPDI